MSEGDWGQAVVDAVTREAAEEICTALERGDFHRAKRLVGIYAGELVRPLDGLDEAEPETFFRIAAGLMFAEQMKLALERKGKPE